MLGGSAFAAGTRLVLASARALGRDLTPFPAPKPMARLATAGPFAVMRHPIYTGVLLGAAGWSALTRERRAVAASLCLTFVLDRKSRVEEALLRERFSDYAVYAESVSRFVPLIY